MSIALLTNKTFLMRLNSDGLWENFIDLTKYPQMPGEAEIIDITRLHDKKKRYMFGLIETAVLVFEANYTKENYAKASDPSVTDVLNVYRVCFGDEMGTDGCWQWQGKVSPYVAEGESNGVRKMMFSISDEGEEPISEVFNPEVTIYRNENDGLTYIVSTEKYTAEENDNGGTTYTITLISSTDAENGSGGPIDLANIPVVDSIENPADSDPVAVMYDDEIYLLVEGESDNG